MASTSIPLSWLICSNFGSSGPSPFSPEVSSHLCWPQGYYDDDYIRVAEAAGFRHLYTTEPGVVGADSMASRLPRIVVKDRGLGWFAPRMWAYRQPALARWYLGRKSR
jgi:hypothetical protein